MRSPVLRRRPPLAVLLSSLLAAASAAQAPGPARRPWAEVPPPAILSLGPSPADPGRVLLELSLVTGSEGADRASVEMLDAGGRLLESRVLGKAKSATRQVEFAPRASGEYRFRIEATRNGEPEPKLAELRSLPFLLPLAAPEPAARNRGSGRLLVSWGKVPEAEAYELRLEPPAGSGPPIIRRTAGTEAEVGELARGARYAIRVSALRGAERRDSPPLAKTVRDEVEREWRFAWFGQSTKAELNSCRILDADSLSLVLDSCSVLPDGQVDQKGGKFTAFHDGISYYYTVVDPERENFELQATFTVEYINPTADGQEGFGILAMDSLGEQGVSARNHYTNSAGVIATKFEATVDGVKRTSKDTLGARFVWGLTPEVLGLGDSGIAARGRSLAQAFSYEPADLVRAGASYTLRLRKSNTGYHAAWKAGNLPEGGAEELAMYGPEKLRQLEPGRVYVGFAAARGCRVRVGEVVMTTSDPATDPPALEEPPELVPLEARVDSPSTFSSTSYPFVFRANADGRLDVTRGGAYLLRGAELRAGEELERVFELEKGINELKLRFSPDPAYRPGPRQALAQYDYRQRKLLPSAAPLSIDHTVAIRSYDLPELWVATNGKYSGKGSRESPLDLMTALLFSKPGQPILLAGGIYRPDGAIVIPRGSDGRPEARKTLRSAPGERAILDFAQARGGMQLWGDFWTIADLDIRSTPDNAKGLQIAGNGNLVSGVATYGCGDTGLQISGSSAEPPSRWPRDNLVVGCRSYGNKDPAANNADGFAAKLTCGEGNVFRGCVAYGNIDDGWDLFSKIESGPIGAVLIEGCVAYANGSLPGQAVKGDGNGFKLGGDGIAVPHVIRNSIAFDNGAAGITSNSDPAIVVENCSSYGNAGANFAFYGKGAGSRAFVARGNLSMRGGAADELREMPSLASPDNYFWNGARSANSLGQALGPEIFVSTDLRLAPRLRADLSIDMGGLLEPGPGAPAGVGARLR